MTLQEHIAYLVDRGFTLREIAQALGCSVGHVGDLKTGRRSGLTFEQTKTLAALMRRARRRKARAS
jgi:transcriptional regulator with XRE-family HTH domain